MYKCVNDLQNGDWCVGEAYDVEGWRECAMYWADSDGYEGAFELVNNLDGQELIDFIQDFWQIEIVKER